MTEDIVPTEMELWNNAKLYSLTHVAEPMIRCRKLISMCLFGVEEIGEEYVTPPEIMDKNKVFALERLLQELIQIVDDNASFMKKKDKAALERIQERLQEIEEVIDGTHYYNSDQRTGLQEIKINQKHFDLCFIKLRKINSEIKKHLGALIFPSSGDFDLEKIKQDIMTGG